MLRNAPLLSDICFRELCSLCDGEVTAEVPSSRYVTLRAGGTFGCMVTPLTIDSLRRVISYCFTHQIPTISLGKGSNLLVRDSGFRGVAIRPEKCLSGYEIDGKTIHVRSGLSLPAYANLGLRSNLSGAEWAIGVPGTIGGAICMNAGCHGVETADHLLQVHSIAENGELVTRDVSDCGFSHRSSCYQSNRELITGASFDLVSVPAPAIRNTMQEYLSYRRRVQPTGTANCGSTFRNPQVKRSCPPLG